VGRVLAERSGLALRLHTDGASRGNPGRAGIGVVLVRAADGAVLEELAEPVGRATNNVAEYLALLTGLRRAAELGAASVEICSDSELLVRQLQGTYQVRSPELLPLHAEARRLLRGFPAGWRIRHVPREENRRADELANLAIDRAMRAESGAAPRTPTTDGGRPGAPRPHLFDAFELVRHVAPGHVTEDVGPGLRLVRLEPGSGCTAAWALVLRGSVEVGGRALGPGGGWRGRARCRAVGGEQAVLLLAEAAAGP
jgi:ribonuclease HI